MSFLSESAPERFRDFIGDALADISYELEREFDGITDQAGFRRLVTQLCQNAIEPEDFSEREWFEILETTEIVPSIQFDNYGIQQISSAAHAAVKQVITATLEGEVTRFLDPFLSLLEDKGIAVGDLTLSNCVLPNEPSRTFTYDELTIAEYGDPDGDLGGIVWAVQHELVDWVVQLPPEVRERIQPV